MLDELNKHQEVFTILETYEYIMANNSKEYNKKNYKKYRWNRKALNERNNRNKARRAKWLKVWDDREVDHKNSNALDNNMSNLQVINRKKNRMKWAMKANRKKSS